MPYLVQTKHAVLGIVDDEKTAADVLYRNFPKAVLWPFVDNATGVHVIYAWAAPELARGEPVVMVRAFDAPPAFDPTIWAARS